MQTNILGVLRRYHLAQLQGGTGLGKTTQAVVVAHALAGPVAWLNCRDADQNQLRVVFDVLARQLESAAAAKVVVFDDLDVFEHLKFLGAALPGVFYVVSQRGGQLLLTGNRPMPRGLLEKLGVTTECVIPVPSFDVAEVRALLVHAGLADQMQLEFWTRLILAKTSGHPQLVSAHIATLKRNHFPRLAPEDIENVPPEMRDLRQHARLLLSRDLPPGQQELLYRLSVLTGSFERRRALALAQFAPAIARPGDAFDYLLGPWIEQVGQNEYRLSPLLSDAGSAANGDEWVRGMHSAIASTWLQFSPQTPWDVATVLVSATLGKNFDAIVRLSMGLRSESDEVWNALGTTCFIFLHFFVAAGQRVPGTSAHRFAFRLIQVQLATHGSPEVLGAILDRVDEEFTDDADSSVVPFRFLLRFLALSRASESLPVRQLMRQIEAIDRDTSAVIQQLLSAPPDVFTTERDEEAIRLGRMTQVLGIFLQHGTTTVEALEEAIVALDGLEPSVRARCLLLFRDYPDMGRQLADTVWLTEEQKSLPDWRALESALRHLYTKALEWQEVTLAQTVASVLVRVLHENLSESDEALTLASQAPPSGQAGYLVLDARAKVLFQTGKLSEAVALWNEILPSWPRRLTGNDVMLAAAARNAGMAAANLGHWSQATDFLVHAVTPDLQELDARFVCGLLADAALAAWRSSAFGQAIDLARRAIQILATLRNSPEDLRSYYLHKAIGHLMTWLARGSQRDTGGLRAPLLGDCSTLDPAEKVTAYNPTPLEATQVNLLAAAQSAGVALDSFQQWIDSLRGAPYPVVRARLAQVLLEDGLLTGRLDDLVSEIGLFLESRVALDQQEAAGVPLWLPYESADRATRKDVLSGTDPGFWRFQFCLALLSLAEHGESMGPRLSAWRDAALEAGAPKEVVDWLDAIGELEGSSAPTALQTLDDDTDGNWSHQLAEMAIILGRQTADPNLILQAHASALTLSGPSASKILEREVCRSLAQAWRRAARRPVTLQRTEESIAPLLQACEEFGDSWSKVGRMFLAATSAVDCAVTEGLLEHARRLAGS